jgi:hypothetical protein
MDLPSNFPKGSKKFETKYKQLRRSTTTCLPGRIFGPGRYPGQWAWQTGAGY